MPGFTDGGAGVGWCLQRLGYHGLSAPFLGACTDGSTFLMQSRTGRTKQLHGADFLDVLKKIDAVMKFGACFMVSAWRGKFLATQPMLNNFSSLQTNF